MQEPKEPQTPENSNFDSQIETPTPNPDFEPAARQGRSPFIKWAAIGAIAVLLAGGLLWYRGDQAKKLAAKTPSAAALAAADVQLVSVVSVKVGDVANTLSVTGALKSGQTVDLSAKVPGRIAQVFVREGQRVARGQLLLSIEDDELKSQLNQARAALSTSQVRLRQQQVGLPARVAEVNSAIAKARTALASSQARYRQAQLQEPAKVQDIAAQLAGAKSGVASAQARLKQAHAQEPATIQLAQAQLNDARQTVKTAETRVEQARTTSDSTGKQVEAEVAIARAQFGAAQASLAEIKRGSRDQQIQGAKSQVREAQVNLDNARTELDRAKFLLQGDAGTQAAIDTAQTEYNLARTRLASAQQNLSLVQEGATNEQIQGAEQGVRQAQAQLAGAQTGRSRIPNAQGEITTALAALAQARQGVTTAQSNLASQSPQAQQATRIAREGVDAARAQFQQARAAQSQVPVTRQATRIALQEVEAAQSDLNQTLANRANIPVAQADVAAAQAGVEASRAQLQQAQLNLASARVYSPVAGVVNTKLVEAGQSVTSETPLLNIVALGAVYFEAQVPETDVRSIKTGDKVNVFVAAVSDTALEGFVSDINPVANAESRQFRLRITVPNPPRQLTPGAFARGEVVTQGFFNTPLLPAEAIRTKDGATTVMIIEGNGETGVARERKVQTGLTSDGQTQIRGGLEKGERVIVGNPLLKDGDKVKVAARAQTNRNDTIALAGT